MSFTDWRRPCSRMARLWGRGLRRIFSKGKGWRARFSAVVEVARVDSLALRLGVGAEDGTVEEDGEGWRNILSWGGSRSMTGSLR